MKSKFDEKAEAYRKSLNIIVQLWCNIPNAYDMEQAKKILQRTAEQWQESRDFVILQTMQMAEKMVDVRTMHLVQEVVGKLNNGLIPEEIAECWKTLSKEEKAEIADCMIALMEEACGKEEIENG